MILEQLAILSSLITTIVLIAVSYKIYSLISEFNQELVKSIFIILSGFITLNGMIIISQVDFLYFQLLNENALYALAYSIHLITWLIGHNYYMVRILRLTPAKMSKYQNLQRYLWVNIVILIVFSGYLLLILGVGEPENWQDYPELIFLGVSLLSILAFILFRKRIEGEIDSNRSKLIQSRLYIINRGITLEIGLLVAILISSILVLSFLPFANSVVIVSLFFLVNIISLLITRLLYSSITIPQKIREQFDIAGHRYDAIKQLENYNSED